MRCNTYTRQFVSQHLVSVYCTKSRKPICTNFPLGKPLATQYLYTQLFHTHIQLYIIYNIIHIHVHCTFICILYTLYNIHRTLYNVHILVYHIIIWIYVKTLLPLNRIATFCTGTWNKKKVPAAAFIIPTASAGEEWNLGVKCNPFIVYVPFNLLC